MTYLTLHNLSLQIDWLYEDGCDRHHLCGRLYALVKGLNQFLASYEGSPAIMTLVDDMEELGRAIDEILNEGSA